MLLEALPDQVEVSVRDDGRASPTAGSARPPSRAELGVRESILGRVADLGGTATLTTSADGTEWEIAIPRETR